MNSERITLSYSYMISTEICGSDLDKVKTYGELHFLACDCVGLSKKMSGNNPRQLYFSPLHISDHIINDTKIIAPLG